MFKEGCELTEDEHRPGQKTTAQTKAQETKGKKFWTMVGV